MTVSYLGFILISLVILLFTTASSDSLNLTSLLFDEAFYRLYGNQNLIFLDKKGNSVQISLDEHTGCGFQSTHPYHYGFFSASIKLPSANYTAGVVATFYTANNDVYKDSHDELDFEFLGHTKEGNWVLQTNIYGNGSINRGREESYDLPFDPSENYHVYSFLWTEKGAIFYVDYVPIREVPRIKEMAGDYPSKPMSLYATIWDGSDWATSGGKQKVDYTYAPFLSQYSDFVLRGCFTSQSLSVQPLSTCEDGTRFFTEFNGLEQWEREKMKEFRINYMTYSYCFDRKRYPIPLPDCLP